MIASLHDLPRSSFELVREFCNEMGTGEPTIREAEGRRAPDPHTESDSASAAVFLHVAPSNLAVKSEEVLNESGELVAATEPYHSTVSAT